MSVLTENGFTGKRTKRQEVSVAQFSLLTPLSWLLPFLGDI